MGLTHGSLFAGIGGFDLGFEWAGIETLWQVENDAGCVKRLEARWPDVTRWNDITKIDFCWNRYGKRKYVEPAPVDILSGGFPCQDVSHAGKRKGLHGGTRSGLWLHFFRAIRQLRPRYVVVENVPGLFSLGFGGVLGDLAACGYDAEWDVLSAEAFGAPHLRERVWIVGYPGGGGRGGVDRGRAGAESSDGRTDVSDARSGGRGTGERDVFPGQPYVVGGGADVADADGTQLAQSEGGFRELGRRIGHGRSAISDAERDAVGAGLRAGGPGGERGGRPCDGRSAVSDAAGNLRGASGDEGPEAPDGGGTAVSDAEPARREGYVFPQVAGAGGRGPDADLAGSNWWATEPDLGRVAHGIPDRVDRLSGLGNAIVPQIAEFIGRRILMREGMA